MKQFFAIVIFAVLLFSCKNQSSTDATEAAKTATPQPAEFADAKYVEIGKNGLANMASKDIATWMNSFADNAVYVWNNGDSLAGKAAISDYWTKRMAEAITEISFTNDI
jgi:PBP1b-binding outer membrane lipoprotein LpoB